MSRRTRKSVGIIGLGIIGRRVSEHLRRQGFSVFVWNRTPRPFPNFVGSPAEIAQLTDFIQIFVSDDAALLDIVQQLKMTLKAQHVVMAHCTVAPHTMREAAEIVQRRGAQFLDAPFTGSKAAAEKGELVYYIGGDESAFRRAKPVLEASSKEMIEIGEIGQATTIKVATNMITAATVQVAAEALAVVQNAGMAPEKFAAAMRGNASNSVTLTMKLPKMIARDFDPHFSVKHMLKDVEIATRMARSHGLSLGATEAARQSLLEEMGHDRGDYDFTSLMRVLLPPAKEPEQPEISVSDHPMLDLRDAAPREESVPLQKEPATAPEPLSPVENIPEPAREPAAKSAAEELKFIEDKPAEAKDESADPRTAEPAQPEEKEMPEPKSGNVEQPSEGRSAPELSVMPQEKVEHPEEAVEARREPEQRTLPEEKSEVLPEAEAHRDGEESATVEAKAEQWSGPLSEMEIAASSDGKIERAGSVSEPAESASAKAEMESTKEPPKASLEPAETAVGEATEKPAESRDGLVETASGNKSIEHAEVSLKPKNEPEVDHLVLSEHDSKAVDGEEKRSFKEMWKDDEGAEETVAKPIVEKTAAEALSLEASPSLPEENVELEEKPEEEVRRGFFSRLFSKTSHEKDADY
ncbi:MAG: NAD(P)-binding domain-containing protein [Chthoniobacterales bacterium]